LLVICFLKVCLLVYLCLLLVICFLKVCLLVSQLIFLWIFL
jgi:hypothetical protein